MDEYGRFAFLYDPLISPLLRPIHRDMLDLLANNNCKTIVDLCCGTGILAGMATRRGMTATGIDLSPAMLARARNRRHTHFVEADATTLPLPDNTFDGAAVSFALHEKPQTIALEILSEANRIVRPGGNIVIGDYRLPEPGTARGLGYMIALVERMAGKEHHTHFRRYMNIGGTDGFLRLAGLSGECTSTHMSGWAGVYAVMVD